MKNAQFGLISNNNLSHLGSIYTSYILILALLSESKLAIYLFPTLPHLGKSDLKLTHSIYQYFLNV